MKFNKLKTLCVEHDINITKLYKDCNITGRTVQAISNNGSISLEIVDRICAYFNCQPSDIMELGEKQ